MTPNRRTLTVRTSDRTRQRFRELARIARRVDVRGDELVQQMTAAVRQRLFRLALARGIDVRELLDDEPAPAVPSASVYEH